jgi:endo-1,4-beta-xylanase
MKPSTTMGHTVLTSSTPLFIYPLPTPYQRNRSNDSQIGPEYIPIAFETAALYDSTVKLYYNDYNIESAGAKSTAAQNLVSSLKARGIKIDGVGLQAHFIVGSTPSLSSQISNLKSFTALGVEVAYTELDIRFTSLPPTAAGLTQQGTDYANTVSACVETTGCVGVTVWDYTDKYSWIPATFSGQGEACLWYSDFTLHPAYYSVVSALGGTATTTTLVTSTATSSASATTTTTTTTTTASGTVAKWGQCGGIGWTGGTVCVAGTSCTYSNAWYSQYL